MNPSKTYTVTPELIASCRAQLGLPVANTGTFNPPSHPEITLGYALVGNALTVSIMYSAWYESSGAVFSALDKYLLPAS